MDTPVVKLSRGLGKGVEGSRWPQKDALQPHGERFNWLRCSTGLGVDFDDMRGVSRAVIFSKAGHRSLLQLFDPLDFPLKAIADIDGKTRVLGVEDVSLRASLEGIGMGSDEIFESVDSSVELMYFSCVIVFPLFDCFKQCLGNPLQGIGIEIGTAVEDVSG